MKSTELRIGNLVKYRFNIIKVNSIDRSGINLTPDYNHWACQDQIKARVIFRDIIPIPLTEEWLFKFGFSREGSEAGDDGAMELGDFQSAGINLLWVPKKGRYTDKDSVGMWINCDYGRLQFKLDKKYVKYVHQLQNLYFALTGEELTIK